jgi:transcriptional regulator with AAA-type ATPase domain
MVLTPVICAFNVAQGLIVSGICSCYQSLEEEKRMKQQEKAIRESIRSELDRSRKMGGNTRTDTRQKRKRDEESDIFESCLRAERRRKLMVQKMVSRSVGSDGRQDDLIRSNSLVDYLEEEEESSRKMGRSTRMETRQKRKRDEESDIFESCLRAELRRKLMVQKMVSRYVGSDGRQDDLIRSNSLVDYLEEEEESSLVTVQLDC